MQTKNGLIPVHQDYEIVKGTTKAIYIILDEYTSGSKVDITGWTFRFTMKTDFSVTDANATFKTDVTNHIDPTGGQTLITLNQTDTASLDAGVYVYDIMAEDDSSPENRICIASGRITIQAAVTTRTTTI